MWGFSYANNKGGCGSARDCLAAECVREWGPDHSPQDNQPALEGGGEGSAEKTEGLGPLSVLSLCSPKQ